MRESESACSSFSKSCSISAYSLTIIEKQNLVGIGCNMNGPALIVNMAEKITMLYMCCLVVHCCAIVRITLRLVVDLPVQNQHFKTNSSI